MKIGTNRLGRAAIIIIFCVLPICAKMDSVVTTASAEDGNQLLPPISYNRQIRPILSQNCFRCHGPDEGQREADLRLDIEDQADLDEIIARITSDDPDYTMPPPRSNKSLSDEQQTLLKQWIAQGAPYEKHWSFVAPHKADVPRKEHSEIHPVDYFIDSRLREVGWTRSHPADPFTRLRRVYLDLIGSLPTIDEADAFAADPSDAAYEAIVDKLLASPRYGERWARRWLDLARYADTNGYEKDRDRSIWSYRDWVIRSLNSGMPFDQFTIEQIAGDMLPNATADQQIATGFHRNTMLNEEGGIDPLEFRYHAMTDRVATTGTTWLGLTTGCAQCHTHKYDPITHHDYFGLMAFLNNTDEPDYFVSDEESIVKDKENRLEAAHILATLSDHWPRAKDAAKSEAGEKNAPKTSSPSPLPSDEPALTFDQAYGKWIVAERSKLIAWQTIFPEQMSANHPYLTQEASGVIFAAGDTSKHDVYTLKFPASEQFIASFRLEALADERLPGRGPGMTYYEGRKGDFYLTEFQVEVDGEANVPFASASETYSKNGFGSSPATASMAIDGDIQTGWSVADRSAMRHVAVFNLAKPIPAGTSYTIRMHFGRHYASSLGKWRLSVGDSKAPAQATLLSWDGMREAEEQREAISKDDDVEREAFLLQSSPLADQAKELVRLRGGGSGTLTLVMRERPSEHTRPTHLHHRGEYTQPQERVTAHLPSAIGTSGKVPTNRLEFARWLVSRDNPLTARVVANRQWAAFFGTGLVKTLDDFGSQGDLPSHPVLLDYLAAELIDQGWSMKSLHRLIVTSQTYQQTSQVSDGTNNTDMLRAISRFPRSRLEAEVIRDAALIAAGLLNEKMFGPPVRPVQPAAATAANYQKSNWVASQGDERFRRSIYTYQKRTAPFAMFTTFDATSGEACVARRDASNTPLQALTLLNDPMFMEIAESYGERMKSVEGKDADKITTGFRWLLTRPPSATEIEALTDFYHKHESWTAVARVMLSLDEAITKN